MSPTKKESNDPEPRDDINGNEQGEPDDDVREALAESESESESESEGGEAS